MTLNRNQLGNIHFAILGLLFGVVTILFMLAREIYQYITYLKPNNKGFEWTDFFRYGGIILLTGFFHYFLVDFVINYALFPSSPLPWWCCL